LHDKSSNQDESLGDETGKSVLSKSVFPNKAPQKVDSFVVLCFEEYETWPVLIVLNEQNYRVKIEFL